MFNILYSRNERKSTKCSTCLTIYENSVKIWLVQHDEHAERRIRMGYKIKEIREEKGMTQEQLSKKANVSRTIISGLENGKIKTTTTGTLLKIAEALEKTVADIFFM